MHVLTASWSFILDFPNPIVLTGSVVTSHRQGEDSKGLESFLRSSVHLCNKKVPGRNPKKNVVGKLFALADTNKCAFPLFESCSQLCDGGDRGEPLCA